jgi:hypothetical protein
MVATERRAAEMPEGSVRRDKTFGTHREPAISREPRERPLHDPAVPTQVRPSVAMRRGDLASSVRLRVTAFDVTRRRQGKASP